MSVQGGGDAEEMAISAMSAIETVGLLMAAQQLPAGRWVWSAHIRQMLKHGSACVAMGGWCADSVAVPMHFCCGILEGMPASLWSCAASAANDVEILCSMFSLLFVTLGWKMRWVMCSSTVYLDAFLPRRRPKSQG